MSSEKYTPTTEDVKLAHVDRRSFLDFVNRIEPLSDSEYEAEFERWLAEHERALSEKVYETAWHDGASAFAGPTEFPNLLARNNPYFKETKE